MKGRREGRGVQGTEGGRGSGAHEPALRRNAADFLEAGSELPQPALRGTPSRKGAASRAGCLRPGPQTTPPPTWGWQPPTRRVRRRGVRGLGLAMGKWVSVPARLTPAPTRPSGSLPGARGACRWTPSPCGPGRASLEAPWSPAVGQHREGRAHSGRSRAQGQRGAGSRLLDPASPPCRPRLQPKLCLSVCFPGWRKNTSSADEDLGPEVRRLVSDLKTGEGAPGPLAPPPTPTWPLGHVHIGAAFPVRGWVPRSPAST